MSAGKIDGFFVYISALSGLLFATSGALSKIGRGSSSSFLVILVQGIICSVMFLAIGLFRRSSRLSKFDRKNLTLRSIFAAAGIGCLTVNYSLSPLPFAFAIANSSPFFFALIEAFDSRRPRGTLFFRGFCLISLGTLVMCVAALDSAGLYGIFLGILGAFFSGLSFRKLSVVAESVEWHVVGFWLGIGLVFLGILGVCLSPWRTSDFRIDLIALSGASLFLAQALMTIGFKKLNGILASVLSFSSIVWASVLQIRSIDVFHGTVNIFCYICMAVGAALMANERIKKAGL